MLMLVARGWGVVVRWDLCDGELAAWLAGRQGVGELRGLYNVSTYISCRARGDLQVAARLGRRRVVGGRACGAALVKWRGVARSGDVAVESMGT